MRIPEKEKEEMKILIEGEYSGIMRDEFAKLGHDVISCDFLATEKPGEHYQGDVLDILYDGGWDMMIAHPPCTFLCNSAVHLLKKEPGRWEKMLKAAEFFKTLWNAPIDRIAIENPRPHGYAVKAIGAKYNQAFQPHEFGDDASKATCFWLKGLPPIISLMGDSQGELNIDYVSPKIIDGRRRYANQSPSGNNNSPPSKDRGKKRAKTFDGIAKACAFHWG